RVQHVDLPETGRAATVAHCVGLGGLALAVEQGPSDVIFLPAADRVARGPEARRTGLIGNVLEQARDAPPFYLPGGLPAELKVVALVVDAVAAAALDQDAIVRARDQLGQRE